ncbi:MAG: FTR1 family iron permease [Thermoleophilaceae bacterium]
MGSPANVASDAPSGSARARRLAWWGVGLAVLVVLVYLMGTAKTGPVDPTEVNGPQTRAAIVTNAALIVFREGLEAILIFAAVTASFIGANRRRRRPVVAGAACAFGATVMTWFLAQALLDVASPLGPRLEAITGLVAVLVLLLILNWFVHHVYWTGWIARHHRQRRRLLASSGLGATLGLVALGFTSVYREGFETVLFLQNLQLKAGTAVVLEGVTLGLVGTAGVGVVTFLLGRRLPYRRMLVVTGVLIGTVLVVMIGGTAATFQDLGWLSRHEVPFPVPEWLGAWFEIYPTYETIGIQVVSAALVIGSYYLAEYLRFRRPRARGESPALRAQAAPEG